jgi:alpha-1,3-mannosyl-glycoprotein beta-1,2-N-acetylglucosaminyltransferase
MMARLVKAVMLLIAWMWIMTCIGILGYHGYYRKPAKSLRSRDDAAPVIQMPAEHASEEKEPNGRIRDEEEKITPEAPVARPLKPYESPLLIFTCQRDNYLRETLQDVLKYIPDDCSVGCPVVISQDGQNRAVTNVITEFQQNFEKEKKNVPVVHLQHPSPLRRPGYHALAMHYGWALQQVFDGKAAAVGAGMLPHRVVILEEDIHVAPDFFDYFAVLSPVLDSDRTLLAVSAFNDNGFAGTVSDATRVLRSDFFPGLGWMMTRRLWKEELEPKWPDGYWDDWLREPDQRKGRHILRPEISRTFHFGVKGGASKNQFGSHLSKVQLNEKPVNWSAQDLSYLQDMQHYDRHYWSLLSASTRVVSVEEALEKSEVENVHLEYNSFGEFQLLAKQLEPPLMDDEKAGIPRTAYKGVVETRPHGEHLLFLTPPLPELQAEFALAEAVR